MNILQHILRNRNIKKISVSDLKCSDKNIILLDVRTSEEYETGHIPDARNINIHSSDFINKIAKLPKDRNYVVYCRSGIRSRRAAIKMERSGFKNVSKLKGGYLEWVKYP